MKDISLVRNFSIIAHIDHGKSTLADRLIEHTETVSKRDLQEQLLDDMELERERGITIKSHPVKMKYKSSDSKTYEFNLIDTPGHVDFTYEVSRSLSACEGAILVIDAAQGIQAQTIANVNLAFDHNLAIIPIINKIDLPAADPEAVMEQLEEVLAIPKEEVVLCSAKEGIGIDEILEAIKDRVPPPVEPEEDGTSALIFDSSYDVYRGVVVYLRMMKGSLKRGDTIKLFANKRTTEVKEVGFFEPNMKAGNKITASEYQEPCRHKDWRHDYRYQAAL